MKHLKTTIKLSVLALACCGAGALALQPTAYAKADDSAPATCVTMEKGAAVYVSDEFSGIRWTTKIDFDKYVDLCGVGKTITFGTLVLPTSELGEDGVLTVEDKGAVDIAANIDEKNIANDTEYYSIINYDNLAEKYEGTLSDEEALKKAYALELTARSYVKVNDAYYYADEMGTSRSARQIALTAELSGEWSDEETAEANKAAKYYGMTERYVPTVVSNGAAGTAVVNLSATENQVPDYRNINFGDGITNDAIDEVLIGTTRMTSVINYEPGNARFRIRVVPEVLPLLPVGEQYMTVFFTDGTFTTLPVVCATNVITTAEELAMFSAKGGYYDLSTKASLWDDYDYWRPEQEQGGYYVLGGNIDANAYVHGSRIAEDATAGAGKDNKLGTDDDIALTPGDFNESSWNGASSYVNKPIGLTGTFNGLGYTIDGMTIGNSREGVFGIVNGGTVKNVSFTDVKTKVKTYAYVLANYLLDAKIDNVYIATNKYVADDANNPGFVYGAGSAILANTAYKTTISNVLLRINKWSGTSSASTFGALFGGTHSSESFTCKNVFAYVRNHFQYLVESTKEIDGVATTTYKQTTAQYYTAMVTKHPALSGEIMETVEKDGQQVEKGTGVYTVLGNSKGENTKGLLYLAENQTLTSLGNGVTFSANAYETKILTGVYYYGQNDDWGAYDPAGFLASGCWTAKSGTRPAWVTREQ